MIVQRKGNSVCLWIYAAILFVAVMTSMHPWFLWGKESYLYLLCAMLIAGLVFVCAVLSWRYKQTDFSIFTENISKGKAFSLILICVAYIYWQIHSSSIMTSMAFACVSIVIVGSVMFLREENTSWVLRKLSQWMSIVLLISLIGWALYLIGIHPKGTRLYFTSSSNEIQYEFRCFYVYMIDRRFIYATVPRFSGLFLEPGHVGMLSALLLAVNRFDWKRWENIVMLIVSLCTFSLAAYVLLVIGYLFVLLTKPITKRRVYQILFIALLFSGFMSFALLYNDGDNVLNNYIVSRFEYEPNHGIVGNNRVTEQMDIYLPKFMASTDCWLGIGGKYVNKVGLWGNAGWKVYLLQFGIIGMLLGVLLYGSFTIGKGKYAKLLCALFLIAFMQRAYLLWLCFIIPAILGMDNESET